MIKTQVHFYIIILTVFLFSACNYAKHLPAGDTLFVGGKVNINDDEVATKKARKVLISDLEGAVRPKPNTKFLGIPYKLDIYNLAGTPKKKKGLRAWLRNKVGEPPVLTSSVNLEFNEQLLTNIIENRGFFFPTVAPKMVTDKKKRTKAVFNITTGPQYHIKNETFVGDSDQVSKDIDSEQDNTLLTPGLPYNLDLIKGERDRIFRALQEKGYYFFTSDYLIAKVDTGIGNHQVNIYMKLKYEDIPFEAYNVYKIGDVYIFPAYRLKGKSSDTSLEGAINFRGYNIVDPKKTYRPQVFAENIIFDKGDVYNRTDQNTTLSRLVNLGTFKYVKNRFDPVSDSTLNLYYYLTPFPKKSLQFQIGALTQNDNRAGSQASISWKNRNNFKGAETFTVKIDGGFQAQYSGEQRRPNIYNLGAETDLAFPRFEVPFVDIPSYSAFIPKTIIKLRYSYESQSDLLRINQYTASYGYTWKEDVRKEHQLYPFNFTYVKTDTLGDASKLNLLYGNLIFNGIILGPTYEFTYNSQVGLPKKDAYFFDGLVDFSGNILGLAEGANYSTHPQTLLGSTYAQYMKYQADFRYYHQFNKATSWATRILIGLGIPYGNSSQLPNVKQFWAGGNSDLRGFPSRLVGPGKFNNFTEAGNKSYIETLGDMKLELNTEYRFNIYKFLNGAYFIDAGNVWLYRDNSEFPGGKFTSQFYQQLAVDMGIGLRFDFKILIFRLDLGMPVRKPWLPDGQEWVFNQIALGDPSWRKNNLVFNIGIGYPF